MAAPNSAASKKAAKAGAKKALSAKSAPATKKTPKTPSSKKTPAKKATTPLRKTGEKMIKKTLGKKGKEMSIKGCVKKALGGTGKASAGGVGAFDLEAFVKIKFSELEKTAHQKKVC